MHGTCIKTKQTVQVDILCLRFSWNNKMLIEVEPEETKITVTSFRVQKNLVNPKLRKIFQGGIQLSATNCNFN